MEVADQYFFVFDRQLESCRSRLLEAQAEAKRWQQQAEEAMRSVAELTEQPASHGEGHSVSELLEHASTYREEIERLSLDAAEARRQGEGLSEQAWFHTIALHTLHTERDDHPCHDMVGCTAAWHDCCLGVVSLVLLPDPWHCPECTCAKM